MGMMIEDDLLYLHTSGNFGHTSSPSIWWVLSNALLWLCLLIGILGVLKKYVDDFFGFGILKHAQRDEATFHKCAKTFFGDDCISDPKTVHPQKQTDVLGWECILRRELSAPNQKGCDKILVVFFCFKLETRQPRELWEVLAGVAERYAAGLIGMKAFVAPLHHMKMKCGIRSILSGRSGMAVADSSAKSSGVVKPISVRCRQPILIFCNRCTIFYRYCYWCLPI